MRLRSVRLLTLFTVTLLLSALIAGCSTSTYKKNLPSTDYSSVYLSLNVKASEYEKINAKSAAAYAYNDEAALTSSSLSSYPSKTNDRYTVLFFCAAKATTATVDFFDESGNFAGCSTVKLPSMGKDLNVSVNVDTVYSASEVPNKYTLKLTELGSKTSHQVGDTINLEATLTTPCGEQIVTDNTSSIAFSTSDPLVISSTGNGTFTVVDGGTATLTAEYNKALKDTKSYTITE